MIVHLFFVCLMGPVCTRSIECKLVRFGCEQVRPWTANIRLAFMLATDQDLTAPKCCDIMIAFQ